MAAKLIVPRRGKLLVLSGTLRRQFRTIRWQSSVASPVAAAEINVDKQKQKNVIEITGQEEINLPVPRELKFDNARDAFRSKTTVEIARALAVFRLCSVDFLVERNQQLLKLGRKVLGKRLFNKLMKMSFYGHFVAGEDKDSIKPTIHNLENHGVGAILDYSVEEDLSESQTEKAMGEVPPVESENISDIGDEHGRYKPHKEFADRRKGVFSARTYFYTGEPECDERLQTFIECVDAASGASSDGFAAIKVTALGRPQLLLKVSEILCQTQYFFDQLTKDSVVRNKIGYGVAKNRFHDGLEKLGVDITHDEADRIFDLIDNDNSGDIDVIEWHEYLTPQLQLTSLFRADPQGDGEGHPLITVLTPGELQQVENMRGRLHVLAEHARNNKVRLMVDAEQTYFQPAIRRFTVDLMREFNKTTPLVFNTYQCYLKNAHRDAQVDMELSRREGFRFGAKLVRGAYMEQERLRASSLGYDDPIHPSYAATSACYDSTLNDIMEEALRAGANVMVASHNEDSVRFAVKRMHELGISPLDKKVFFGQLLGMSDPLSFTLGHAGYSVYKYVPYGPVEDVLPYLSRRAMENRGLLKGILKERSLLWTEFTRRIREREMFKKAVA